jgi:hypothetical protein
VEPKSEPVEIREEHDESRHLKITTYQSTEENIVSFDFNDPTYWPNVNDKIRRCLVEHGPDQGMDADFRTSVSEDRRRFSLDWFSKKLPNGESTKRNRLIYLKTKKSLFCFCCILFGKVFEGKQISQLANHKRGFSNWKHLYRLEEHENSPERKNSYLEIAEKILKT